MFSIPNETLFNERWRVSKPLGEGRFGQVYRVKDRNSGPDRALKFLPKGRTAGLTRDRFVRELSAQLPLKHGNILKVHDYGEHPEGFWLVMDLAGGESLESARPQDNNALLKLLGQTIDALAYLHQSGVIHGDLKPANLFWENESQRVQLGDFGLAAIPGTEEAIGSGTPAYMAPELLSGTAPSAQSDLYAFALLAWELLAGRHPFPLEPLVELLKAQVNFALPTLPPGLPGGADALLKRLAAKSPADRPSDAVILQLLWRNLGHDVDLPQPELAGGTLIGRERDDSEICRHAVDGRPVWLHGPKGIGKSALVAQAALNEWIAGRMQLIRIAGEIAGAIERLERQLGVDPQGRADLPPGERLAKLPAPNGTGHPWLIWEDFPADSLTPALLEGITRLQKSGYSVTITSEESTVPQGWIGYELSALNRAQTEAMVRSLLVPAQVDSSVFQRIYEVTGGVPGAIRARLEEWIAHGIVIWSGRLWGIDGEKLAAWVPSDSGPAIPKDLQALVQALAPLPIPATWEELQTVYSIPTDTLNRHLRNGLRRGVVAEVQRGERSAYRLVAQPKVHFLGERHREWAVAWQGLIVPKESSAREAAAWHYHYAGNTQEAMELGLQIQELRRMRNQMGEALHWVRRLLEWNPQPEQAFRLRKVEGLIQKNLGRPLEAQRILEELLAYARKELPAQAATLMGDLGVIFFEQGKAQEAADWFRQAVSAEAPGSKGHLRALNNLAGAYLTAGQLVRAREAYSEALDSAIALSDLRMEVVIRANLGELETRLGHLDSALPMLREAKKTALVHKSMTVAARVGWVVGRVLLQLGNASEALNELRQLQEMAPLLAGGRHAALPLLLEAELALSRWDGERCIKSLAEAEAILAVQADPEGLAALSLLKLWAAEQGITPIPSPPEMRRLSLALRAGTDPADRAEGLVLRAGLESQRISPLQRVSWLNRAGRVAEAGAGYRGRLLALFLHGRAAESADQETVFARLREELRLYPWTWLKAMVAELTGLAAQREHKPLAARAAFSEASSIWRDLGALQRQAELAERIDESERTSTTPSAPVNSEPETRQLWSLIEVIRAISQERDPERLQRLAVDRFLEISGLGRAILFETDGERVKPILARDGSDFDLPLDPIPHSRTAIRRVLADPRPLFLEDVVADEEMSARDSVTGLGLRAVVTLPLILRGRLTGLLYADAPYMGKPFGTMQLEVLRALALQVAVMMDHAAVFERLEQNNRALREQFDQSFGFNEIVGRSKPMVAMLKRLSVVAPTDVTLFLSGETGTGKDLVARAVHAASRRAAAPFVAINCAAVPEGLLESELFGHEKGAFTGATQAKPGRFELADGGTLFLDEIGETPPAIQAKLLRVLQDLSFERVGGTRTHKVDLRLIVATNRPVQEAISSGRLREDLYYRISSVVLTLPPLRQRKDDIPYLVAHFVKRAAERYGKRIKGVSGDLLERLMERAWPGNIRELEHVVEQMVIFADGPNLTSDLLPELLGQPEPVIESEIYGGPTLLTGEPAEDLNALKHRLRRYHDDEERRAVVHWLEAAEGNITEAAEAAGIHRVRLHQLIKKFGIRITE